MLIALVSPKQLNTSSRFSRVFCADRNAW